MSPPHATDYRSHAASLVSGYVGNKHKAFNTIHQAGQYMLQNNTARFHFITTDIGVNEPCKPAETKFYAVGFGRTQGVYGTWK